MRTLQAEMSERIMALRLALQHEHFMPSDLRYKDPEYEKDIQPLVIQINEWLIKHGYKDAEERRNIRLKMLSFIVQRKVETSYDLTQKEAQIIGKEIARDIEERKSQLLEFISNLP
jgi:hypothetical protein